MRAKIAVVLLISVFFQINISAQNITIQQGAKEESKNKLSFYSYDVAFFDYKTEVFSIVPDSTKGIKLNLYLKPSFATDI